jgi:hypothetical protein
MYSHGAQNVLNVPVNMWKVGFRPNTKGNVNTATIHRKIILKNIEVNFNTNPEPEPILKL